MAAGVCVLIYDGECPVCGKSADWIEKHSIKDSFEMIACQSEETRLRFPQITEDACLKSLQLILPDGRILSGADALPEITKRLKRYRSFACLFALPGATSFSHWFYRWFSDHRAQISDFLFPGEKRGSDH